jgi:hypothetical protein
VKKELITESNKFKSCFSLNNSINSFIIKSLISRPTRSFDLLIAFISFNISLLELSNSGNLLDLLLLLEKDKKEDKKLNDKTFDSELELKLSDASIDIIKELLEETSKSLRFRFIKNKILALLRVLLILDFFFFKIREILAKKSFSYNLRSIKFINLL